MARKSTAAVKKRAAVDPAPPLAKAGSDAPTLSDEELARLRVVRAADVTAPLPPAPIAPANDDGLPILLAYQGRWVADTADVKVAEKSRRIGLTWAEAFDCVTIAAAARGQGGTNCFYIGYNFEMAREFIASCAMWAKHLQQAMDEAVTGEFLFTDTEHGDTRAIKAFRIVFASGFSIIALPSRPRSLRGMQGVVILDEAAFHDDLPEMIKAAMALLMWGGKVRIISTHDGDTNAFNDLVQEIRAGRKPYSLHRITLDDALADGLYRRICTSTGKTWSAEGEKEWRDGIIAKYAPNDEEELFCVPSSGSGAYFALATLEAASNDNIPVLRYEQTAAFGLKGDAERFKETQAWIDTVLLPVLRQLPADDPHSVGGDFARSGDLSTRFVYRTTKDNRRRCALVIELRNVPYKDQEQIEAALLSNLPRWQAAKYDKTGNGTYLAERMQQRFGANRVEGIAFTSDWHLENWPRLRAGFEDRTADLPNQRDIFADFRLVTLVHGIPKVPENKRTTETGGRKGQRHGDVAIAAVLAYAASRAEPFTVAYETPASRPRDLYEPRARTDAVAMRWDDDDELSAARERSTL